MAMMARESNTLEEIMFQYINLISPESGIVGNFLEICFQRYVEVYNGPLDHKL